MISVLYVDDEPDLLELGTLFLQKTGRFTVTTAISARDAFPLVAGGRFDLILSDYQMPEMDGIAFLKEIREKYPNLPFILFTGRGREEVVIQAINSGADFYIQKGGDIPAQFAELAHKITVAVERRQAVDALRDSEQRLSDIINFLPDATFAIDTNGTVIAWNRAIEEVTGIPASGMIGRNDHEYSLPFYGQRRELLIDLILGSEEAISRANYENVQKEGGTIVAETSTARVRGVPRVFLCKASLLRNKDGDVTGAIESIRDITDNRRSADELRAAYEQITASEEELREQYDELKNNQDQLRQASDQILAQNRELRLLKISVDRAYDEVFWMDFDGTILYVNDSACRVTGYLRDELIGMKIYSLDPDFPPEIWDASIADLRERGTQFFTTRHRKKDGTIIHVEIMASYAAEGSREFSFAFVRDISGRIREEEKLRAANAELEAGQQALRASEEKYRSVIENIQEVFYRADSRGIVLMVSPSVCRLLQYDSPDEILGRPVTSFYYQPDKRDEVLARLDRDGYIEDYEIQLKKRDGTPVWVSTYSHYYRGPDGKIAGVEGVYRDISRRKQIEEDLKAARDHIAAQAGELRARLGVLESSGCSPQDKPAGPRS